jgi:hypothetical protein
LNPLATESVVGSSGNFIAVELVLRLAHWNLAVYDANAEVTKMIKTFGAPICETDVKAIADYLTKNYGS